MAKGLTLEIKGLSQLQKQLSNLSKEKRALIADDVKKTAYAIEKDAKIAAPVDMGFLRQSIRVGTVTETEATVQVDANYAAYVEFGTGALVDVPQGLEDYAIQFKGKGERQVNLPARPFFFPPVFKHYKALVEGLKKKI